MRLNLERGFQRITWVVSIVAVLSRSEIPILGAGLLVRRGNGKGAGVASIPC